MLTFMKVRIQTVQVHLYRPKGNMLIVISDALFALISLCSFL